MGISEGAVIDPFLPGKVLKMSAGFVEDAAASIQAARSFLVPLNPIRDEPIPRLQRLL